MYTLNTIFPSVNDIWSLIDIHLYVILLKSDACIVNCTLPDALYAFQKGFSRLHNRRTEPNCSDKPQSELTLREGKDSKPNPTTIKRRQIDNQIESVEYNKKKTQNGWKRYIKALWIHTFCLWAWSKLSRISKRHETRRRRGSKEELAPINQCDKQSSSGLSGFF